jgi:hypothetical protein
MRRLAFVLPLLACGCATTGQSEVQRSDPGAGIYETTTSTTIRVGGDLAPSSRVIPASADRVWGVLPAVFQEIGVPVEVHVPDARQIGNQRVRQARVAGEPIATFLRCASEGSGPSSVERLRHQLSVLVSLIPQADGRTHLSTQVTGSATRVEGSSQGPVQCVSTGLLEERIANSVLGRVRS